MRLVNWDIESRSVVDLTSAGSYVYFKHPSTQILCISYTFDRGKTMRRWRTWTGEPTPPDLLDALRDPNCIFEGWNASFERLSTRHLLKMEVPPERFRCTMARARSMALPGKLELAARALHVPVQKGSQAIMLKWCAPLKSGGWADDPDEYEQLCDYCDLDVRTEIGIGDVVREMTDEEWEDYHITEHINDAGLPVDLALAGAAQHYARDELDDIKLRLNALTNGVVTTPKQYQRIKAWIQPRLPEDLKLEEEKLEGDEVKIGSFDRAVREELLGPDNEDDIRGDVREFIELVHDGGRASTAKFEAMRRRADADARVRGCYIFNGAAQTHRFSATGVQPHNMIRAKLERIEDVIEAILRRVPKKQLIDVASYRPDGSFVFEDKKPILKPYNVLTILGRTLRPSIVAERDKVLVWSDAEQIEARVLPWLSAQPSAQRLLDLFATGADVYKNQALSTFNVKSLADVTPYQRQACKVQILAFGFGGGVGAGHAMGRNYGLFVDDATMDMFKTTWRGSNPWAQPFWNDLETAAFSAVRKPEQEFHAGRIVYMCAQGVLWCMLPNGSMLAYPMPEIRSIKGKFGPQDVVTAIKGSFHPKKGTNYWPRMKLWGGFQAENVTQGFAAQMLRYWIRELWRNDWPIIGHTHDEILCEVFEDEEDECKHAMETIMSSGPAYAAGLPLAAEVSSGYAYGK